MPDEGNVFFLSMTPNCGGFSCLCLRRICWFKDSSEPYRFPQPGRGHRNLRSISDAFLLTRLDACVMEDITGDRTARRWKGVFDGSQHRAEKVGWWSFFDGHDLGWVLQRPFAGPPGVGKASSMAPSTGLRKLGGGRFLMGTTWAGYCRGLLLDRPALERRLRWLPAQG